MDIRYMTTDEIFTPEEKLDHCLKHLKGNDKFDYTFLESMKRYVENGYWSDTQKATIEKIWNRWNIGMLEKENPKLLRQEKLETGYNKMMDILENCPTHKEENTKMEVDEKEEIITKLEKKIQHLEALLKIYMP
jgi:hypothetical protein